MIAWIDGVMVSGSPQEIQQFREINGKKKTNTDLFKIPVDGVPEHVKNYGKNDKTYVCRESNIRAYF